MLAALWDIFDITPAELGQLSEAEAARPEIKSIDKNADAARKLAEQGILLPDGSKQAAKIVGRSPSYDIAVVRVPQFSQLVPVTLGSALDS